MKNRIGRRIFNRKNIFVFIISFLLTFCMLIGYTFDATRGFEHMMKYPQKYIFLGSICIIVQYFLYNLLFKKIDEIVLKKEENIENKKSKILIKIKSLKISKLFDNNPFEISVIFIFLCYLPIIFAFFPGMITSDSGPQILQFLGYDTAYSKIIPLINPEVKITNHHPVLHTIIIGSIVKLSLMITGDIDLGIFLNLVLQLMLFIGTLGYTIKFMKELNVNIGYRFLCLLIYSFLPIFSLNGTVIVKDIPYTSFLILFIIWCYKVINKNELVKKDVLKLIILSLLVSWFRNEGMLVVTITIFFMAILIKKTRKKMIITLILVVSVCQIYKNVLLPICQITPGSIREALPMPMQATMRYIRDYPNDITTEEILIIDKVMIYENAIKEYNPTYADMVKDQFRNECTKEELIDYFMLLIKLFFRHPDAFIESYLCGTYGYINPYISSNYFNVKPNNSLKLLGYSYSYLEPFYETRYAIYEYYSYFKVFTALRLIGNIGFYSFIMFFVTIYLIYKKEYKCLIYFVPLIMSLFICTVSPVNAYMRYAIHFIMPLPMVIGIVINSIKEKRSN